MSAPTKRDDVYSRRARRSGYVARSVYKLQEIQRRYGVLASGMHVLDLGAAPGSWSQLSLTLIGGGGRVTAVDRRPLKWSAPNLQIISGDLEDPETIEHIRRAGPFDAILSDSAPDTSGNRLVDCARSANLVEIGLELSHQLLHTGGNLVAKLFQGSDTERLQQLFAKRFRRTHRLKPAASNARSCEIYLIGLGMTQGDPK